MPRLSNSGRGGGSPHVERFLSEGAKRMAGCEIALDVDPNFKTHREARVAVIHASSYAVGAAMAATTAIPIVFNSGGDPIKQGLVASLNRPVGNVTGVSWLSVPLEAKHVEQLHELMPAAGIISVLLNRATPGADETYLQMVQEAASAIGLQVHTLSVSLIPLSLR